MGLVNEAGMFQCQRQNVNCPAASNLWTQCWGFYTLQRHGKHARASLWYWLPPQAQMIGTYHAGLGCLNPILSCSFSSTIFSQHFFSHLGGISGTISSAERMSGDLGWCLHILEKDNRLTDRLPNTWLSSVPVTLGTYMTSHFLKWLWLYTDNGCQQITIRRVLYPRTRNGGAYSSTWSSYPAGLKSQLPCEPG